MSERITLGYMRDLLVERIEKKLPVDWLSVSFDMGLSPRQYPAALHERLLESAQIKLEKDRKEAIKAAISKPPLNYC